LKHTTKRPTKPLVSGRGRECAGRGGGPGPKTVLRRKNWPWPRQTLPGSGGTGGTSGRRRSSASAPGTAPPSFRKHRPGSPARFLHSQESRFLFNIY